jgi:hypothetical protein
MRFVLFPLIILMLTAGIALAEKQEKAGSPSERVARIKSGKYSRMLISMVQKTSRLDLTDQQKTNVRQIRTEYIAPIVQEENESRTLQGQFMNQLQESDFDPSEMKTVAKKIDNANAKISDMFIDGIAALREAVGEDNYAKLSPVTNIDGNTLIKLKEQEMARGQKQAAEPKVKIEPESKSNNSE